MARSLHLIAEMQSASENFRREGKTIAVVPTMGYLHEGHLSLVRIAKEHADLVVTTIFVNPTQFGPHEDFSRYPRDLRRDIELASDAGTDIVFAPETQEMYPDGFDTFVEPGAIATVLEGRSRPGHFKGVATIVAKLFHSTKPHVAVFGQKDAQQVAVIRRLVRDLDFDVRIMVGPIVREGNGLAMSSRNTYLNAKQREEAAVLFQSLQYAEQAIQSGETQSDAIIREMQEMIRARSSGEIDYISIADGQTLEEISSCSHVRPLLVSLAVRFGPTRLIDNSIIS